VRDRDEAVRRQRPGAREPDEVPQPERGGVYEVVERPPVAVRDQERGLRDVEIRSGLVPPHVQSDASESADDLVGVGRAPCGEALRNQLAQTNEL
jgi:hypothetical protein